MNTCETGQSVALRKRADVGLSSKPPNHASQHAKPGRRSDHHQSQPTHRQNSRAYPPFTPRSSAASQASSPAYGLPRSWSRTTTSTRTSCGTFVLLRICCTSQVPQDRTVPLSANCICCPSARTPSAEGAAALPRLQPLPPSASHSSSAAQSSQTPLKLISLRDPIISGHGI